MTRAVEIEEGSYPMRVVTRLTGLNADTIRVWQRRYGAVDPRRTSGRARRFNAEDVRRLLLMREATSRGHAIRDVAGLSEEDLTSLLGETGALERQGDAHLPPEETDVHARLRTEYLSAIGQFEIRRADELLARAATLLEPTEFVLGVVGPLLREVGDRWMHDDIGIAHEHIVSSQLKSLVYTMMRFVGPQPGARKLLVTTPEDHLHEFGALIGAYLAASRGHEPIYLGPNLPERDILVALELSRADLLLLSIARDMVDPALARLADSLRRIGERTEIWLGLPEGHAARGILTGVRFFSDYRDLDAALTDRML